MDRIVTSDVRSHPALIVLAAGASERLGECKALVELAGRTALERVLDAASAFDSHAPLVVAGAHVDELRRAAPLGVEVARHAEWRRGRLSSVRLAHRLRPDVDLCIAQVDTPLVRAEVFARLLAHWLARGSPARGFLAPFVLDPETRARHGHPIVIGRELASELETLSDSSTLRTLRARAAPLFDLEVFDLGILDDLDTPLDLARLRARLHPS